MGSHSRRRPPSRTSTAVGRVATIRTVSMNAIAVSLANRCGRGRGGRRSDRRAASKRCQQMSNRSTAAVTTGSRSFFGCRSGTSTRLQAAHAKTDVGRFTSHGHLAAVYRNRCPHDTKKSPQRSRRANSAENLISSYGRTTVYRVHTLYLRLITNYDYFY